jgi:hypothetical protein
MRKRKFHLKFSKTKCPSGDTISKLETKVRTHGTLIDRKPLKTSLVILVESANDGSLKQCAEAVNLTTKDNSSSNLLYSRKEVASFYFRRGEG